MLCLNGDSLLLGALCAKVHRLVLIGHSQAIYGACKEYSSVGATVQFYGKIVRTCKGVCGWKCITRHVRATMVKVETRERIRVLARVPAKRRAAYRVLPLFYAELLTCFAFTRYCRCLSLGLQPSFFLGLGFRLSLGS